MPSQRDTDLRSTLPDEDPEDAPPGFFGGKPSSQRPTKRQRTHHHSSGGPPLGDDATHELIEVPAANLGWLIGAGGSSINAFRSKSRARIDFDPDDVDGDGNVSVLISSDDPEAVKVAKGDIRAHMAKVGIRGEDAGEYEDWLDVQLRQRRAEEAACGTAHLYELDGGEKYPNTDKAYAVPASAQEWTRGWDAASGRAYWWNARTQASVWEESETLGPDGGTGQEEATVEETADGLGLLAGYGSDGSDGPGAA